MKKLLIFILFFILLVFFVTNCGGTIIVGIPDIHKGYYLTKEPIFQEDYLHLRVFNGGFRIWLGLPEETNNYKYYMVEPDFIVGNLYNYSFSSHTMSGTLLFSDNEVRLNFFKNGDPIFQGYDIRLEKRVFTEN